MPLTDLPMSVRDRKPRTARASPSDGQLAAGADAALGHPSNAAAQQLSIQQLRAASADAAGSAAYSHPSNTPRPIAEPPLVSESPAAALATASATPSIPLAPPSQWPPSLPTGPALVPLSSNPVMSTAPAAATTISGMQADPSPPAAATANPTFSMDAVGIPTVAAPPVVAPAPVMASPVATVTSAAFSGSNSGAVMAAPAASGGGFRRSAPPRHHTHAPSMASSVFDDSDDSEEEQQELARRSARMYPHIAPAALAAAPAAAAITIGGGAGSAGVPPLSVGAPSFATSTAANAASGFGAPGIMVTPRPKPLPAAPLVTIAADSSSTLLLLQQLQLQVLQQQHVLAQHGLLLPAAAGSQQPYGPSLLEGGSLALPGSPTGLTPMPTQSQVKPQTQQLQLQQQQSQLQPVGTLLGTCTDISGAAFDTAAAAALAAHIGVGVDAVVASAPGTAASQIYRDAAVPSAMHLSSASWIPPQGADVSGATASQQQQPTLQERYLRQWIEVRPIASGAAAPATVAAAAASVPIPAGAAASSSASAAPVATGLTPMPTARGSIASGSSPAFAGASAAAAAGTVAAAALPLTYDGSLPAPANVPPPSPPPQQQSQLLTAQASASGAAIASAAGMGTTAVASAVWTGPAMADAGPVELELGDKGRRGGTEVPSADLVAENLENIDAIAIFEPEEDEDELEGDEEPPPPWYRRPTVRWFLVYVGLGLALLIVGVVIHTRFRARSGQFDDAFRWCYFFAAMPLLYYGLSYASRQFFTLLEWWFFRESLLYLANLQRSALWLLFFLALLPWYYTVFRWAWCESTDSQPRRCQSPAYVRATAIVWNVLLCLTLFCLANSLKAVLAKLLTTHFYRTAHFEKLKRALEREYALQVLSRPRRLVLAEWAAAQQQKADASHHPSAWLHLTSFLHHQQQHQQHQHHHLQNPAQGQPPGSTHNPEEQHQQQQGVEQQQQRDGVTAGIGGQAGTASNDQRGASSVLPAPVEVSGAVPPPVSGYGTGHGTGLATFAIPEIEDEVEDARRPKRHTADVADVGGGAIGVVRAGVPPAAPSSPVFKAPIMPTPTAAAAAAVAAGPGISRSSGGGVGSVGGTAAAAPPPPLAPAELPPESPSPTSLGRPATNAASTQYPLAGPAPSPPQPSPSPLRTQALQQPRVLRVHSSRGARPNPVAATGAAAAGSGGGGGGFSAGGDVSGLGGLGGLGTLRSRRDSHTSRSSKVSVVRQPARATTAALGDVAAAGLRSRKVDGPEALTQAMVEVAPPGNARTAQKGLHRLSDAELEKVRTAIVIKTQSALISKYTDRSDEDMAKELGRVKRFAKALFFNVLPPEAGRDHLVQSDLTIFFEESVDGAAANAKAAAGIAAAGGAGAAAAAVLRQGVGGSGGVGVGDTASGALARESRSAAAAVGIGDGKAIGRTSVALSFDRGRAARQRARQKAAAEAAAKAFAVFDTDNNGEVTRTEVREAVVNIYKERRNMARSLKDTETIVQSLEFGIGGVIHFVFAALYLLIWGVDLLTGFSTFSATVLALTFVFGNSVKNMYESMLFLFVTHPYDVGDCVLLGTAPDMYRIKKISLLYTDMVKSNGERVYMPNTSLIAQGITNWTRSRTKSDSCRLVCDVGVAWEVREDIQAALRGFARAHPGEFDGEPSCNFRELVDPLKVVLVCSWMYNFAPDEFSRLSPARNGMLFIVQSKAREHRLHHTTFTDSPN